MSYLIDTHILYWSQFDRRRLPASTIALLEDRDELIYYSVITPWELSIKQAKGKISLPRHFFTQLPQLGFDCLGIEETHVNAMRALPKLHGDPFDRMLAAQAVAEKMTLITADKRLAAYPLKALHIAP